MKRFFLVALTLLAGSNAYAQCEFDVEVGDGLWYSVEAMEASADCDTVTVNLKHTGQLPAAAMGHNWVLSESDDVQAITTAGMSAGLAGNYLPADDDRIIAGTKVVGGGESTSISFSLDSLDPDGSYTFFCSFPGHLSLMQGSFTIS